jgi:hypothetical protein
MLLITNITQIGLTDLMIYKVMLSHKIPISAFPIGHDLDKHTRSSAMLVANCHSPTIWGYKAKQDEEGIYSLTIDYVQT